MMDLESLSAELTRKFGEDAAQHALMRIVERGWHVTPGENKVEHFAKVCAYHFKMTEVVRQGRMDSLPEQVQRANALDLADARQQLMRLDPVLLDATFWGQEEAAKMYGVERVTIGTRVHRQKRRLAIPTRGDRGRPSSSR